MLSIIISNFLWNSIGSLRFPKANKYNKLIGQNKSIRTVINFFKFQGKQISNRFWASMVYSELSYHQLI
jgi:hypothetical protein